MAGCDRLGVSLNAAGRAGADSSLTRCNLRLNMAHRNRSKEVSKAQRARWKARYPHKHADNMKAYRINNLDKLRENDRNRWTNRRYGITSTEYRNMVDSQGNLCAVCGKPETYVQNGRIVNLSVDHNHTTGKNRGLVCIACNAAIGFIKEDIQTLKSIITYLQKYE